MKRRSSTGRRRRRHTSAAPGTGAKATMLTFKLLVVLFFVVVDICWGSGDADDVAVQGPDSAAAVDPILPPPPRDGVYVRGTRGGGGILTRTITLPPYAGGDDEDEAQKKKQMPPRQRIVGYDFNPILPPYDEDSVYDQLLMPIPPKRIEPTMTTTTTTTSEEMEEEGISKRDDDGDAKDVLPSSSRGADDEEDVIDEAFSSSGVEREVEKASSVDVVGGAGDGEDADGDATGAAAAAKPVGGDIDAAAVHKLVHSRAAPAEEGEGASSRDANDDDDNEAVDAEGVIQTKEAKEAEEEEEEESSNVAEERRVEETSYPGDDDDSGDDDTGDAKGGDDTIDSSPIHDAKDDAVVQPTKGGETEETAKPPPRDETDETLSSEKKEEGKPDAAAGDDGGKSSLSVEEKIDSSVDDDGAEKEDGPSRSGSSRDGPDVQPKKNDGGVSERRVEAEEREGGTPRGADESSSSVDAVDESGAGNDDGSSKPRGVPPSDDSASIGKRRLDSDDDVGAGDKVDGEGTEETLGDEDGGESATPRGDIGEGQLDSSDVDSAAGNASLHDENAPPPHIPADGSSSEVPPSDSDSVEEEVDSSAGVDAGDAPPLDEVMPRAETEEGSESVQAEEEPLPSEGASSQKVPPSDDSVDEPHAKVKQGDVETKQGEEEPLEGDVESSVPPTVPSPSSDSDSVEERGSVRDAVDAEKKLERDHSKELLKENGDSTTHQGVPPSDSDLVGTLDSDVIADAAEEIRNVTGLDDAGDEAEGIGEGGVPAEESDVTDHTDSVPIGAGGSEGVVESGKETGAESISDGFDSNEPNVDEKTIIVSDEAMETDVGSRETQIETGADTQTLADTRMATGDDDGEVMESEASQADHSDSIDARTEEKGNEVGTEGAMPGQDEITSQSIVEEQDERADAAAHVDGGTMVEGIEGKDGTEELGPEADAAEAFSAEGGVRIPEEVMITEPFPTNQVDGRKLDVSLSDGNASAFEHKRGAPKEEAEPQLAKEDHINKPVAASATSTPSANTEFIDGLDDVNKIMENVDPTDELDVGAAGSSMQDIIMGQGTKILRKRIAMAFGRVKREVSTLNSKVRRRVGKFFSRFKEGGREVGSPLKGVFSFIENKSKTLSQEMRSRPLKDLLPAIEKGSRKLVDITKQLFRSTKEEVLGLFGLGEDEEDDDEMQEERKKLEMWLQERGRQGIGETRTTV